MAMSVEYFWVRKFLLLSEGAIIICRWGSGDDAIGGMWDVPRFGDIPLGSAKVPSSRFLGLVTNGLSNLQRGISFVFLGFCRPRCLMGLKLIPILCLFAYRMARGHEETSTNQAGRKRGTSRETPTVSNLVATMSIDELRSFSQVPADIKLEVADGTVALPIGRTDNATYFT